MWLKSTFYRPASNPSKKTWLKRPNLKAENEKKKVEIRNCLLQRIDQNVSSSEDRLFRAEDQDQSMQEHFLSSLSLLPIGGARQPSWLLLADVSALRPTLDTSTASFHLFSSSFDHLHTECVIICFCFSPSLFSILLQKHFLGKFERYWLHLVSAEKEMEFIFKRFHHKTVVNNEDLVYFNVKYLWHIWVRCSSTKNINDDHFQLLSFCWYQFFCALWGWHWSGSKIVRFPN